MFTGIVEKIGVIHSVERAVGNETESFRLEIDTGFADLSPGESVAVNGVCLTVEGLSKSGYATFNISEETRRRTNLGKIEVDEPVNLERALLPTARLSGHWVQGHVDGSAVFVAAHPEGDGFRADFDLPGELGKYCVEKGSIALDGVSLTIGMVRGLADGGVTLRVFLIPHTWKNTTLCDLEPGARVNVEVDILAKYIERLLHSRS